MLDPLTGLANRAFFVERLATALAPDDEALAVFCIDLDRFKLVNDSLGHDAGDRLLVEVARRLRDTLPPRRHRGAAGRATSSRSCATTARDSATAR